MAISSCSVAAYGLAAYATYLGSLAVYRLYFSPLAKFPGPKLAALSNWYEFYYDVIREGDFTWQIKKLHEKYGPIVRITPTELHIDDPEYYHELYARGSGRRDKYHYFSGRFGYASDTFSTVGHDLHRNRRKAISPFFSIAKIADFQPVIRAKVDKLCDKLDGYASNEGSVVPLSSAWMALTTDIISEYSFAKSYDQLSSPDFEETLHEALVAIYVTGHFALHFSVVFPILDILPEWLVKRAKPEIMPVAGLRKDLAAKVNEIRAGINGEHKSTSHPTIFHELLNNTELPEEEKSNARLGDEAQLIIAAGLITTSRALSVASYHLAANPAIALRLREELREVEQPYDWRKLESLPYLNGVIRESMRLAHGIVTRDPRLAPDDELHYGEWTIPRNTPVSMTTYDILMNEDIFPNPNEFVPERWIGKPEMEKYFVPFGKGTRQCIGINLAQAELYVTVATIFTRYQFEPYETDRTDVDMAHAYLVPYSKWESKGVRATVKRII
ncbi:related to cytochrome P450 CYP3/CYP5/CYP6/CYP9 subfamilies [Cephalotrichum gorgonifer]|uniref:Related to cytochrome P450 CYP3/CYP5/CYP6/CYP9 subfamilies n=1 Tax=Cephalotrichum gorgonifer TaxID=2041049 RepID=A0AAE8N401_9PEZI|nr:related to cytochrome P450 CYP3/CYP5/CYP6/CYP9 subfamilies [Cephalotrichum gorgonifer]